MSGAPQRSPLSTRTVVALSVLGTLTALLGVALVMVVIVLSRDDGADSYDVQPVASATESTVPDSTPPSAAPTPSDVLDFGGEIYLKGLWSTPFYGNKQKHEESVCTRYLSDPRGMYDRLIWSISGEGVFPLRFTRQEVPYSLFTEFFDRRC